MNRSAANPRGKSGFRRWGVPVAALVVLLPSLYGFATKFSELVAIYRGEADGAFAIGPIVNYLLASAGFLLLFLWATFNGMFHDIEQPKRLMLEREAALDRGEAG